jgi:hypothetical protein
VPAPLRLTLARRWRGTRNWPHSRACAFTSPMPPGSVAPTRTPAAPVPAQGHQPVGVLAARRDRRPAQQPQDARLRDPRRGVRRAGGQGRQRRHVIKCGGCSLWNLNPPFAGKNLTDAVRLDNQSQLVHLFQQPVPLQHLFQRPPVTPARTISPSMAAMVSS